MRKLICHTDLLCDQPFFVAQFVAQQKVFRADGHRPRTDEIIRKVVLAFQAFLSTQPKEDTSPMI